MYLSKLSLLGLGSHHTVPSCIYLDRAGPPPLPAAGSRRACSRRSWRLSRIDAARTSIDASTRVRLVPAIARPPTATSHSTSRWWRLSPIIVSYRSSSSTRKDETLLVGFEPEDLQEHVDRVTIATQLGVAARHPEVGQSTSQDVAVSPLQEPHQPPCAAPAAALPRTRCKTSHALATQSLRPAKQASESWVSLAQRITVPSTAAE